jgi:hypothetical protein
MVPLNDLGTGTYQGYEGGLYPNGSDAPPAATEAYAVSLAQQIVPLNSSGQLDTTHGKIVMVSVGMSNTEMEYSQGHGSFMGQTDSAATRNPQLVLVNGAQGGRDAPQWVDPDATTWHVLTSHLKSAGVTAAQVQMAWVELAIKRPDLIGGFPVSAQALQSDLEAVARNLMSHFPNIKIAYFSSMTHAYTTRIGSSNPEPWAYEGGFAVQWMMQDQIDGTGNLNYDPSKGTVVAPLVLWGPYLWATSTPRSDGFTWLLSDVRSDRLHPTSSGITKVGSELETFSKTDPSATPWFLKPTPAGQGPVVTAAASVTSGAPGLSVNFTASATDSGARITQYAWTYDDGDFSLSQNPTKIFNVPGTYTVHLTVSDSLGRSTQTTLTITITPTSKVALVNHSVVTVGAAVEGGSNNQSTTLLFQQPPASPVVIEDADELGAAVAKAILSGPESQGRVAAAWFAGGQDAAGPGQPVASAAGHAGESLDAYLRLQEQELLLLRGDRTVV